VNASASNLTAIAACGRGRLGAVAYTAGMGAVETMEVFFELLNAGDREGAVGLMDERTEMRIHVGDSVQTLRGVERVGGWFLRSDKGLKMIPGEVRDTGNTYEADLLVVRPGATSQHLDAIFRVEAGKITSINLAPR
jgi:ketosteroid isomerase-like protein